MPDDIPVLSEALFETFGSGSWAFLPATTPEALAAALDARIVDDRFRLAENPGLGDGPGLLVLTAPVNGWVMLLGASETVGAAAAILSDGIGVFQAMIDVRLPAMSWSHLEGGAPTRTVSVELGDDGDLVTRTTGDPLPFEAESLVLPTSPLGFDPFFYPMAILAQHGVTLGVLADALRRPSVTLALAG